MGDQLPIRWLQGKTTRTANKEKKKKKTKQKTTTAQTTKPIKYKKDLAADNHSRSKLKQKDEKGNEHNSPTTAAMKSTKARDGYFIGIDKRTKLKAIHEPTK